MGDKAEEDFQKRLRAVAEANKILGVKPGGGVSLDSGKGFGTGANEAPMQRTSYEGATLQAPPMERPRAPGAQSNYSAPSPPSQNQSVSGPAPASYEGATLGGAPPSPMGPAPPPAQVAPLPSSASSPSKFWQGAKEGAINLGLSALGPVGAVIGASRQMGQGAQRSNAGAPPPASAGVDAPPVDSSLAGAPGSGGGGPDIMDFPQAIGGGGQMIPGGWQPSGMSVAHQDGVPVPEETRADYGEAIGEELMGAEGARDAEKSYQATVAKALEMQEQAAIEARDRINANQAQRDEMWRNHIQKTDALNQEANAKINPDKIWEDRGALAKVIAAIGIGMGQMSAAFSGGPNTAAQIVDSQIQREINSQIENRKGANDKIRNEQNLIDLHHARFGDMDAAAKAAKMGLYDSTIAMIDKARADKGLSMADPNYLAFRAQMLKNRGSLVNSWEEQEKGKTTHNYSEAYHGPQMVGGASGKLADEFFKQTEPGNVAVIPPFSGQGEGKRVSISNPATATDLQKVARATGALHRINRRAAQLLGDGIKARGNISRMREITAELDSLAEEKASLGSMKLGQGTLKEGEYWRSMGKSVGFNGNFAKLSSDEAQRVQRFLRNQDIQAYKQLTGEVQAAGGSNVVHKFVRHPKTNVPIKVQIETGTLFEPDAIPPEMTRP